MLASSVPDRRAVATEGIVLVDDTVARPTGKWAAVPGWYSAKLGYAGMSPQITVTQDWQLVVLGPIPVRSPNDAPTVGSTPGGLRDEQQAATVGA